MQTGELRVFVTDSAGQAVTAPGFTFNVSVGAANGQVISTVSTDASGSAVAGALNPATYCVTETGVPDGFQLAPRYSPGACVPVTGDPTQGRNPTTVIVANPASASPTPSPAPTDSAAALASPSAVPSVPGRTVTAQPSSLPVGALAKGLIGLGALLLLVGGVLVGLEIRRRRRAAAEALTDPDLPDVRYDSTIT
jgi:hypothetical protein